jgi:S1-C subfamily serine protease
MNEKMDRIFPRGRGCFWKTALGLFLVGVLLGHSRLALAFDLFSSGKNAATIQESVSQPHPLLSFTVIANAAMPAVVNISSTPKVKARGRRPSPPSPMPGPFRKNDPFEEFFCRFFGDRPPPGVQRSLGSGFISEDGFIVTNNHS